MEEKQFQRERYWRREKKREVEEKNPNGGKYRKRKNIGKAKCQL